MNLQPELGYATVEGQTHTSCTQAPITVLSSHFEHHCELPNLQETQSAYMEIDTPAILLHGVWDTTI